MYNVHLYHKPGCLSPNKRPRIDGKIQLLRVTLVAMLENNNNEALAHDVLTTKRHASRTQIEHDGVMVFVYDGSMVIKPQLK